MERQVFHIDEQQYNERLDKYLSDVMEGTSRSYIQKLIREGRILVNGQKIKSNCRLRSGDEITAELPEAETLDVVGEDIPLSILYEDDDLLVVDKPKEMVVHPAAGHSTGTLVHALLYHCGGKLSGINGVLRPGIVHRIDRDTTGALVVCKSDRAHQSLSKQLKEHSITRRYRGIVTGNVAEEEGTVRGAIGRDPKDRKRMAVNVKNGKDAVTHYRVLERFGKFTYMEFTLETGRTHQIRAHMKSIGHPLLGDTVYGPARCPYPALKGQTLHAMVLGFCHPVTGTYMEFEAPLPAYFEELLKKLRQ